MIYSKDPEYGVFIIVLEALRCGRIQGFVSDTAITFEGIKKDHRATVFGNTQTHRSFAHTSDDTLTLTLAPVQVDRLPLHPKQAKRFMEAFRLGIRLLGAPRIGMPRAEEQFYVVEEPSMLEDRLNRFVDLARRIEAHGLGSSRAQEIATRFAAGRIIEGPWFNALGLARDIHEKREVARAFNEWADADSVAVHYSYGNDIFCTGDFCQRRGTT